MKTTDQLSQLDDSMFSVIENRKLTISIGRGSLDDNAAIHAKKKWFGGANILSTVKQLQGQPLHLGKY